MSGTNSVRIRRRPQGPDFSSQSDGFDLSLEDTDKKGGFRHSPRRFNSLQWLLIITIIAFIVSLIGIASYINGANDTTDVYQPNNRNSNTMTERYFNETAKSEDNGIEKTSLDINDIPDVRYENFKAIKARMDYAISNGAAEDATNVNITCGQYLLDFGIIGFPKCGTTTMMKWLNMHDNIAVLDYEITALQKYHPARLLHYIMRDLPEGRFRRGYKSPSDVGDGRARNKLGIHYGKTKLLVGLRHPILWFESFYNHRIQNGYDMPSLTELITKKHKYPPQCSGKWKGVCFSRANFHTDLAKWGKTPLLFLPPKSIDDPLQNDFDFSNYSSDDEWAHFSESDAKSLKEDVNRTDISPNPMFLYDVSQLQMPKRREKNDTEGVQNSDYDDFILSLQAFLGVPKNVSAMPAMIRESPGKKEGISAEEQLRRNSLKIDLCDAKYEVARKWLLEIGSNVQLWIRNYFVRSKHKVFVAGGDISSSSRFLKIIQTYGEDPCPERIQQRMQHSQEQNQQRFSS